MMYLYKQKLKHETNKVICVKVLTRVNSPLAGSTRNSTRVTRYEGLSTVNGFEPLPFAVIQPELKRNAGACKEAQKGWFLRSNGVIF